MDEEDAFKAYPKACKADVVVPTKKLESLSYDGEDVFEIIDYTLASAWEKFIAQIETVFRQWHLDEESYGKTLPEPLVPNNNTLREAITYEGQSHQLIYHFMPLKEKREREKMRRTMESGRRRTREEDREDVWRTWFPEEMKAIMNAANDFPFRAHHLQRWFGLREFLILAPLSDKGCSESEAALLLSALSIVINETKCPLPVFVPIGERWRGQYIGYLASGGICTRFDSVLKHSIPSYAYSLGGLLSLMYQQLGITTFVLGPRNTIDFSVSARYTRVKTEWTGDWRSQETFDALHKENDCRQTGYWQRELLWGTSEDPLDSAQLAEAWINLTPTSTKKVEVENVIDSFPWGVSPKWSLRTIFKDKPLCFLTESIKELMEACDYSKSFTSFTELKSPVDGSESEVPHLLNAVGSLRRTLATFRYGHLPTAGEIDSIMQDIFDKRKSTAVTGTAIHLKAAPPGTLLSSLSTHLLNMRTLHGMALVWFEFVKELRWHWEERVPLPALPTNQIDYNSCLLYQKLQMLNYCIGRARTMEGKDDPEEKLGMIESPLNEPTDSDGIEEEDNRSARSLLSRDEGLLSPYSYSGFDISNKPVQGLHITEEDIFSSEGEPWDTEEGWDNSVLQFSDEEDEKDKERKIPQSNKTKTYTSAMEGRTDRQWDDSAITPEKKLTGAGRNNLGKSIDSVDSLLEGQCTANDVKNQNSKKEEKRQQLKNERERERELGVKRSGVTERVEGLTLLQSGLPVYVPLTQDHGRMTEDMIREQEDILASLGSSAEAQKIRARMQSASLLSDMQAFKAANPGCVLEDFVRWYSPADWIEQSEEKAQLHTKYVKEMWRKAKETSRSEPKESNDDDGRDEDQTQQGSETPKSQDKDADVDDIEKTIRYWTLDDTEGVVGHLSQRMQIPNNLWRQVWQEAQPMPILEQKLLFDHLREGEKVLHLLEAITPSAFMEQIVSVILSMAYNSLVCLPACKVATVRRAMADLQTFLEKLDLEEINKEEREGLYSRMARAESLLACATSLLLKLNNRDALVDGLLSDAEVDLHGEAQRAVALQLFTTEDSLYEPDAREFILRCTMPCPLATSRPVGHRLYVLLTDSEFRVATAISTDE